MNSLIKEASWLVFDPLWEVKDHSDIFWHVSQLLSLYLNYLIFLLWGWYLMIKCFFALRPGGSTQSAYLDCPAGHLPTETRCLVAVCLLQCAPPTPCTAVWPWEPSQGVFLQRILEKGLQLEVGTKVWRIWKRWEMLKFWCRFICQCCQ